MDLLRQAFLDGAYILDDEAHSIDMIIDRALDAVIEHGKLPGTQPQEIRALLLDREQLGSTAIGHAVAVPHAYVDYCVEQAIIFIRLAQPIDLGAPDGIPTRFIFVLLVPLRHAMTHCFKEEHLAALDAEEEPDEEAERFL